MTEISPKISTNPKTTLYLREHKNYKKFKSKIKNIYPEKKSLKEEDEQKTFCLLLDTTPILLIKSVNAIPRVVTVTIVTSVNKLTKNGKYLC